MNEKRVAPIMADDVLKDYWERDLDRILERPITGDMIRSLEILKHRLLQEIHFQDDCTIEQSYNLHKINLYIYHVNLRYGDSLTEPRMTLSERDKVRNEFELKVLQSLDKEGHPLDWSV